MTYQLILGERTLPFTRISPKVHIVRCKNAQLMFIESKLRLIDKSPLTTRFCIAWELMVVTWVKWLKKFKRIIFSDMWKVYELQIPSIKFYYNTAMLNLYVLSMAISTVEWQNWVAGTQPVWSKKPKLFTLWSLKEKIFRFLE